MRKLPSVERVCAVLAVALLAVAGPALGQGAPFGGTIVLTLTPSTTTPLPGSNFDVNLGIDASAATGTCPGPSTVPFTLGSYSLGVNYDNTKFQYVGIASCGVTQFVNPVCNDTGTVVNCNDTNTGNTNQPQGNVCVAKFTFRYISTTGSGTLTTVHAPAPRGVASNLINGCGGPSTFPSASVTDATSAAVSPATPTAGNNGPVCEAGTLDLTTPSVSGATYAWTGPNGFTSTLQNPSISPVTLLDAGTFYVTTTVNGVTSSPGSTAVTVNPLPATPSAGSNSPVCAGSAINLTTPTVAGATYAWTGPNGYTSPAQNPTIPAATTGMSGTYSVTVAVSGCVSAAGSTSVTVNPIPAAPTAGSNTPVCAGSAIDLTTPTVAGATYAWTGPNGYSSNQQNPTIASATTGMSGTYSVTVSVNGCVSPAGTTDVTVNAVPSMPTAGNNGPICEGGTLNLTTPTVGGATYAWTGPNGFNSNQQNPSIASATPAASGSYSVTVTVSGCQSPAGTTIATVNATPATPVPANGGPICAGGTLNLTVPGVGGATYAWTGPNGFTSTQQNPSITNATTAYTGTYSVRVTVNSCQSAAGTTDATVYPIPTTPTAGSNSPLCAGATLNLTTPTVSGAAYSWTGPNGFNSATQNPSISNVTTLATGTYSVTVSVNGCASAAGTTPVTVNADATAPVVAPPGPVTVFQTTCCGTFGGVTPGASAALATFVAAGTATDDCDPSPTKLTAQLGGSNIGSATCFESGANSVTFRFQDAAGHTGTANATATVRMYADLNTDNVIDPSDMVVLRGYFNFVLTPGTAPFSAPLQMADLNHDADVNPTDFVLLRAYFNFVVTCLAP